jgi:hypothetical protein
MPSPSRACTSLRPTELKREQWLLDEVALDLDLDLDLDLELEPAVDTQLLGAGAEDVLESELSLCDGPARGLARLPRPPATCARLTRRRLGTGATTGGVSSSIMK